jgi:hypothetical protein
MVNWGNGAKGAAGGAAAGAAFGPYGAAIGGVIGGGIGLFTGGDDAPAPPPVSLPYFEEDRARLGSMMDGQSPFAGSEWGGLIAQLQARASGNGPSVAGNAYKQASADSQAALYSMAQNSAGPGGARQAMLQAGRINQGLAQGYSAASLQEQQANQGALSQALGARDAINSTAYQNLLSQQLGLSRSQLAAQQGNQNAGLQEQQIQNAQSAGQYQALSGLALGLGKIYGNSGGGGGMFGGSGGGGGGGGPITQPSQVDGGNPFGQYQRNYYNL